MKARYGFISNSSSCSFLIINKTKKKLTVGDFLKENPQLIDQWNKEYCDNYTLDQCLKDPECKEEINPGYQEMIFGDEHGGMINTMFDYILREGGESERFEWRFREFLR
jgi:hypothetical protein